MAQSFDSHTHHPVPTYLASVFALAALVSSLGAWWFSWPLLLPILALTLAVFVLVALTRTYIVRLQDRIILLEMKVRCAELLPAGEDDKLRQLTPKQIVALRFAGDQELSALLERAVREKLAPVDIKRAIRSWRDDTLRT